MITKLISEDPFATELCALLEKYNLSPSNTKVVMDFPEREQMVMDGRVSVTWTKRRPTKEGLYWARTKDEGVFPVEWQSYPPDLFGMSSEVPFEREDIREMEFSVEQITLPQ